MKFEFNTIAEIIQQVCEDRGVKIPTPSALHLEAIFGEGVSDNRPYHMVCDEVNGELHAAGVTTLVYADGTEAPFEFRATAIPQEVATPAPVVQVDTQAEKFAEVYKAYTGEVFVRGVSKIAPHFAMYFMKKGVTRAYFNTYL